MSSTAYVNVHTLAKEHTETVNALSFSPAGAYLASGSDDKTVIIWNILKGSLLHRLFFDSCVDCVLWHPLVKDTLIVACEDGTIEQVSGFSLAHNRKYPINFGVQSTVHALDYHAGTGHLAAAIGTKVHITKEVMPNKYSSVTTLLPHPTESFDPDDPRHHAVTVKFDQNGKHLVVTYLHHGIVCWDIETQNPTWNIDPTELYPVMGYSAISPNDRHIAVHNFQDGLLMYFIDALNRPKQRKPFHFDVSPNAKIALQVAFVHAGDAVVCGTTTGEICIWQTRTGELFQQLSHDDDVVPAIAATQRGDYSYIATGCAFKGPDTVIKIWRARIPYTQTRTCRGLLHEVASGIMSFDQPLSSLQKLLVIALLAFATLCFILGASYALPLVPWTHLSTAIRYLLRSGANNAVSLYTLVRTVLESIYTIARDFICAAIASAWEYARLRLLSALGVPPNLQEILERWPPA